MITTEKLNKYREDLNAVLRDWSKKNGLKVGTINFRYNSVGFKASIEFDEVDESGSKKIDPYYLSISKSWTEGTSLEGQTPFGHTFKTRRGTEAKLVNYHPNRKFSLEIEEFNPKKGVTETLYCDFSYMNHLKEPIS
jgi:hypothetical protein